MANSKQAKKRIRQNLTKRQRNKSFVSKQRTELKKLIGQVQENKDSNSEEFKKQLKTVISLTDSSVNRKIFHKNKAARIKSRLLSKIHGQGKIASLKQKQESDQNTDQNIDNSSAIMTDEISKVELQE